MRTESRIVGPEPFRSIHLVSCVGIDTDLAQLRHFVTHYRSLGILPENFHLILNTDVAKSINLKRAEQLLGEYDIVAHEIWIAPYTSEGMWAKRREVQNRCVSSQDWMLSADVDELHEYPTSLPTLLAECESKRVNCVQGVFIDRLSADGRLVDVGSGKSIWQTFPVQADVQCTIGGLGEHHNWFGTVKLMAFKAYLFPSRGGHHFMPSETPIRYLFGRNIGKFPWIDKAWFRFWVPLRVHHFKWTASMPATLRKRHDTRGVSAAGLEYGRKLLDYLDLNKGINLADVPVRNAAQEGAEHWRRRVAALRAADKALRFGTKLYGSIRRISKKFAPAYKDR